MKNSIHKNPRGWADKAAGTKSRLILVNLGITAVTVVCMRVIIGSSVPVAAKAALCFLLFITGFEYPLYASIAIFNLLKDSHPNE